jgi:hypothetical protein
VAKEPLIPLNRSTVISYFKEPKAAKAPRRDAPPKSVVVPCPNCAELGEVDPLCPVCRGEGAVRGLNAQ